MSAGAAQGGGPDLPADLMTLRDPLAALAAAAGAAILEVYEGDFDVRLKDDASPVTEADLRSQAILQEGLAAIAPGVPILAEEGTATPYARRRDWTRWWCVDPLDGTRDFVARSGEFSVNVGLLERGRPLLGLIHAPLDGVSYVGAPGRGAWRREGGGPWCPVSVAAPVGRRLRVFASRQHAGPRTLAWLRALAAEWDVEVLRRGSAMKVCLVADGSAHLYPRLGPTSEWDTAAAEAIVVGAGGVLRRTGAGGPLAYNKRDLRNPDFYAAWGPEAPHP
ncbi:MAG: 3'(2'),5'-bisphosphate nucleotidase CysQ [Trueperaceae bacterium]